MFFLHRTTEHTMSRREPTARAQIWATLLFLDNEHQNRYYAEVAECLGATSQLEKPFPPFHLDARDVLLTLNGIDIQNTPSMAIKELIESFLNNSQKPSTDKEDKLLTFSYVKAQGQTRQTFHRQIGKYRANWIWPSVYY